MRYTKQIECTGSYDVIVAGGGASGIAAAVSAAELGAKVLIIEKSGTLGGGLTLGHVGPTMGKYGENTFAHRINRLLGCVDRKVQDFELAKIRLTQLVYESGVDVYLNTSLIDVIKENDKLTHAVIAAQSGPSCVEGKIFVDATADGVLSYMSGEEYEMGRDDGLVQPVSVMFIIDGVDPEQKIMCRHEKMDTTLKKGNYLELCKRACESGELPPEINIVRLYPTHSDTERMVNATQICGTDPLDPLANFKAQYELRMQMDKVVDFLKNNVEGFENIRIKSSSDIIGVRESRRVVGEYTLSAEDLIEGRRFDDVIVHKACFPLDIHNPNGAGQAESSDCPVEAKEYDIPYRALLPKKTENLYTCGRCISGTHRAHASYRVMNTVMNIGEAVGIGAALCVDGKVSPREIEVRKIQEVLASRKVNLFD